MGSRTTPPTSSHGTSKLAVNIKKESPDDEIKEYAETAMNELLGWYGYEKVDSRDTQGLNLHHFSSTGSRTIAESPPSPAPASDTSSDVEGGARSSSSPGRHDVSSPGSPQPPVSVPAGCMACAWCQKVGQAKMFSFKTTTPNGQKAFCSEVCFTQCRRASFKRNKTCDWCRHVRHTVNYVDFQDGDHQLQFCSDKCLNQYKMNIFCKETQAHLQLHPHLKDAPATTSAGNTSSTLITPELWMRDCRSVTPDSDRSCSPTRIPSPIVEIKVSPTTTPPLSLSEQKQDPSKPSSLPQKLIRKDSLIKTRRTNKNKKSLRSATSGPIELRATSSSSPRSAGSITPPKNTQNLLPPIPHYPPLPPPHLLPPDHPLHRPPFVPPGLLPPPHIFSELGNRFPIHRPPQIRKPHTTSSNTLPPPLLPITRPVHPPPILHPPPPPPSQSLLPPATVLIPYPILLPIPIPVPIPIPIPNMYVKKESPPTGSEDVNTKNDCENKPIKREISSPTPPPLPAAAPSIVVKSTTNQPLRKRKRPDISTEDNSVRKQKSVPA